MSKILNNKHKMSSMIYSKAAVKRTQAAGWMLLAMAPMILNLTALGTIAAAASGFDNAGDAAAIHASGAMESISKDPVFLGVKNADRKALQQKFENGEVSRTFYEESVKYLNSDEYALEFAKLNSMPEYSEFVNSKIAENENNSKEMSAWASAVFVSGACGFAQYHLYKKGFTGKVVGEALKSEKAYKSLKKEADKKRKEEDEFYLQK